MCRLRDNRRDRLRLRHVDGMTPLDLGNRRNSATRHFAALGVTQAPESFVAFPVDPALSPAVGVVSASIGPHARIRLLSKSRNDVHVCVSVKRSNILSASFARRRAAPINFTCWLCFSGQCERATVNRLSNRPSCEGCIVSAGTLSKRKPFPSDLRFTHLAPRVPAEPRFPKSSQELAATETLMTKLVDVVGQRDSSVSGECAGSGTDRTAQTDQRTYGLNEKRSPRLMAGYPFYSHSSEA